jgi:hypothetical protein
MDRQDIQDKGCKKNLCILYILPIHVNLKFRILAETQ